MSDFLEVYGANTHNLKNVSVKIPKNKLTVITGVSGSGKSSLAFDTIYAEGQRRYLESLSTYARMIISSINEDTKVEEIKGLSPTISINQKTVSTNPRSTVGTITEIYDFYRLLYTNIGIQKCPEHGVILKKYTSGDIVEHIKNFKENTKFYILAPLDLTKNLNLEELKKEIVSLGFIRYMIDGKIYSVGDEEDFPITGAKIYIVVDRLVSKKDYDIESLKRLNDSINTAFKNGDEFLEIYLLEENKYEVFSRQAFCPVCKYKCQDLVISNFSFNSHYGACESCHGLGMKPAFLEEKIINFNLSLNEGSILPWNQSRYYIQILETMCKKYHINMNKKYSLLTKQEKNQILYGTPETFEIPYIFEDGQKRLFKMKYEGVIPNLERKYHNPETGEAVLKKISSYVTETECEVCTGFRLKKDYLNVFVGGLNIGQLAKLSVSDSIEFFSKIKFTDREKEISKNILKNIIERLEFLNGVGLAYMTISRRSNTLSGGESQRIRLATQIGTKLEGIIYVLDEPSIGLHSRDNNMLIANLKRLSENGNTVITIEHDEDIMKNSDYIIDIGPGAGLHGGNIVFAGTYEEILKDERSVTGQYLSNKLQVELENKNRKPYGFLEIIGATENNLKNVDVKIPLGVFNVVTGVSGSGKSSLMIDILSNHLLRKLNRATSYVPGKFREIKGIENLDKIIMIDQSPIGKTSHSNVATYTGVFNHVRDLMATTQEAQRRGFLSGRLSFNTKGGRCEICEGSGTKKIEMHFGPDVYVECEACHGLKYNNETLEVKYKGKNISQILDMSVEEAKDFFASFPKISRILDVLFRVGLGYIKIGQTAPTLSGGESQRIKLATELAKRSTSKTIYVLDEPTTGLHFSDIQKLLNILDGLVDKGNTVLVIEHNLDFIDNSDYIIDIGPEGGEGGGQLLFSGKTKDIISCKNSYTGEALKKFLENKKKQID
ncbi:MAG: excinuclease ABC subunit UvrA [Candidatus Gracilibacteria bacterium]|nr:excinuclease ABC subunit UvrA [Candidatus Gracilibacteria bacterium]